MTKLHEGERQEVEPESPIEIIERALISAHDVTSEDAERATEWLAELMRRDWAVRVLDAWAFTQSGVPSPRKLINGRWGCLDLIGATPDTARHAAAQAVFPTLDRNAPSWPGECP